ncbi:MAG TPA: hypothetical protein VGH28_01050 [Polyangiaceae bacterium]|jgi:hypothetical protein
MSWGQQPGYGQQQGYGYAPQPPPKKGIGAGAIIAILAGIFALLVVAGGVVAFLVLRSGASSTSSSSSSSAEADHSEVLKTKAETLLAAVKTGNAKQVEDPLLDLAMTPETAKAWFTATFEPKAADDLEGYWERQVFPNITELARTFKKANAADQTEVRVTRFANAADVEACQTPFCKYRDNGNLSKVFAAMKKPQALYLVSLAKPGSTPGTDDEDVFFFAEVKGGFAYLGELQMM